MNAAAFAFFTLLGAATVQAEHVRTTEPDKDTPTTTVDVILDEAARETHPQVIAEQMIEDARKERVRAVLILRERGRPKGQ